MKRITTTSNLKWLIIAALIFTILGVALDWKGFIVNTFSGILGATIGVWVSIEVVETVLNRRRVTEWNTVKDNLLREINFQLTQSCLEYLALLPAIGHYSILMDDMGIITTRKAEVANKLYRSIVELDMTSINKSKFLNLYDNVRPHLDKLNDMKVFYTLIPGPERELIGHLQEVEKSAADWSEMAFRDSKTGISKKTLSEKALNNLSAISSALEFIARSSN